MYGISVYTNEDFTLEENKDYINKAKSYGFNKVFTSLHLPEVKYEEKLDEIKELYLFIKEMEMELSVDISSNTMKLFKTTPKNLEVFYNMGISCLRLDYGFSPKEMAIMTHNEFDLMIELNASTLEENFIEDLIEAGADLNKIRTCHNFYPKPYTALSYEVFKNKCEIIKKYGLEIGAFIPSLEMKRGPIYEGLPTLESHRCMNPYNSAKFLIYSGLVDTVYFGDAYAGDEELERVSRINPKVMEIEVCMNEDILPIEKDILFKGIHSNRKDSPEYVIRSVESRGYNKYANKITPHNNEKRHKYSITIDNVDFKRYAGELMICRTEMPKDSRVNLVGYISTDDEILVDFIKPGGKFKFIESL